MLRNAFKMHLNFEKNGTMKIECVSSLHLEAAGSTCTDP